LYIFYADAESSVETEVGAESEEPPGDGEFKARLSRGRRNVITQDLAQTLDSSKLNNRQAAKVLAAAASALGADKSETNINVTTIRRKRDKFLDSVAATIRENFKPDEVLVVHWDGKIVPTLTGKDSVDRQAVVVSGKQTSQLLGAPAMTVSTGKAIGETVAQLLRDWGLVDKVKAMCYDTTNGNSGKKRDFILKEKKLEFLLFYGILKPQFPLTNGIFS